MIKRNTQSSNQGILTLPNQDDRMNIGEHDQKTHTDER